MESGVISRFSQTPNQHLLSALAFFVVVSSQTSAAAESYSISNGQKVAELSVFQECDVCPEMIALPKGRFVMGAPLAESKRIANLWFKEEVEGFAHEGPQHEVEIDIAFAMGRNEVTIGEWQACQDEGGCPELPAQEIQRFQREPYKLDDSRFPVIKVSYQDAQHYVRWLNAKVGTTSYRLPTEAEWEYAARAGTSTKFPQGNVLTSDQANVGDFDWDPGRKKFRSTPRNRNRPVLVDELGAPNAWGLRHVAGNAVEQTMTCWRERHPAFPTSSEYLRQALETSSCDRVTKGGAYGAHPDYARPANRGQARETHRSPRSGFRVLRELEGNT